MESNGQGGLVTLKEDDQVKLAPFAAVEFSLGDLWGWYWRRRDGRVASSDRLTGAAGAG